MNIKNAIETLEQHNKWRKGNQDIPMIEPKTLGIAIDTIVNYFNAISIKINTKKNIKIAEI